ncbi:MAG: hypothetical protein Q7W53_14460 [Pseudomonadota bacterium]|nr:hypothetical protein [Pseudomonadota bacterium]MDP2351347.1 hypothetical protein [Pseudomonadota bacterium]
MSTMITEVYEAFISAGAPEDKAKAAARAVAEYDSPGKQGTDHGFLLGRKQGTDHGFLLERAKHRYGCARSAG